MLRWTTGLGLLTLALACRAEPAPGLSTRAIEHEAPNESASTDLAALRATLAPRLDGRAVLRVWSSLDAPTLILGVGIAPRADTDEVPVMDVAAYTPSTGALVTWVTGVRALVEDNDALWVVDERGFLSQIVGATNVPTRTPITDHVRGAPTVLPDGRVVVSRAVGGPGETDLYIIGKDGASKPLAAAPGPDDLPWALADGRVAFVSGRTTVASIWIADPTTDRAEQLTNHGLAAGRRMDGFVPVPMEHFQGLERALRYDAGGGAMWEVELATGVARRIDHLVVPRDARHDDNSPSLGGGGP